MDALQFTRCLKILTLFVADGSSHDLPLVQYSEHEKEDSTSVKPHCSTSSRYDLKYHADEITGLQSLRVLRARRLTDLDHVPIRPRVLRSVQ